MNGQKKRRGAILLTAGLTAVMVLIFIGVNLLATVLENRYALNADLSFNALTLQSAVTEETLGALPHPVDIYLMTTGSSDTMGDSVILRRDMETVLERYRSRSDRLRFETVSLLANPTWATRYADRLNGETVTQDCVLLVCEETGRARMLTADDFLRLQYDLDSQAFVVTGYAIEQALTEGLISVSSDVTPVVQVLTGHGERDAGETDVLESHLAAAGYQVRRVSLHGADSLDSENPLLILSPRFDLGAQELDWLRDYLRQGGGILYTVNYERAVRLPNFDALLKEYGLTVEGGIVVATGEDATSYLNDSRATLLPYMQAVPETEALLRAGQDILLMPGSRAITVSDERSADIYAEVLLKSGAAYIRRYEDGIESLDRQEGDPEGFFSLAALARRYTEDGAQGTLIVVGSDTMFLEDWIYDNTYQDAFLRALLRAGGTRQPVTLDIAVKSAARAGLGVGPLTVPRVITCLLPLLVLAAGLIILLPRRHL